MAAERWTSAPAAPADLKADALRRRCIIMETDSDVWAAPPEWIHLPAAPSWMQSIVSIDACRLVPKLIQAVRDNKIVYRVAEILDRSRVVWPSWIGEIQHPRRCIVTDWEKAEPNWAKGTICGNKSGETRQRHPIEISWQSLNRWAPPVGRDLATASRMAEAPRRSNIQGGKSRGGRPATHDWDAFWVEVACWSGSNDLYPEEDRRKELRKHMLVWVSGRHPVPDDSTVDRKLSSLFEEVTRKSRKT